MVRNVWSEACGKRLMVRDVETDVWLEMYGQRRGDVWLETWRHMVRDVWLETWRRMVRDVETYGQRRMVQRRMVKGVW